jgi:hypothetical protein
MSEVEFVEWPKTSRLFRDITITEKIDGTNAAVNIAEDGTCVAQSRTRCLTNEVPDNFGFRAWVLENSVGLFNVLGPGRHFGEWWGRGIQRGYDLDHKRFSLFNTHKWGEADLSAVPQLSVVPVLAQYTFDTGFVSAMVHLLKKEGSVAAPGYDKPEGVCVYHHASNNIFKVLIENDEGRKG